MRGLRLLSLLVTGFAALCVLGLLAWTNVELDRPTDRSKWGPGRFRVPAGASLRTVTEALADSGWIRYPRLVAWWGRVKRFDRELQVGRYQLGIGWSPRRILTEIRSGSVEMARVTIPEGWREEKVLRVLADSLELDRLGVLEAATDSVWLAEIGMPGRRLEGYLFPETYTFPKEYDPRRALGKMVDESNRRFDASMRRRAAGIGMCRDEVVILASIVQAEAARESEMPRIAAVFHNRLRRGWRLEADPTVLYALARSAGPVLTRDLEVVSPYNTYRNPGLPPGAIGNPGSAALRAVLWPDSTRDELYFVAIGNGEHEFSRTLAEHNRARKRAKEFRRKRR